MNIIVSSISNPSYRLSHPILIYNTIITIAVLITRFTILNKIITILSKSHLLHKFHDQNAKFHSATRPRNNHRLLHRCNDNIEISCFLIKKQSGLAERTFGVTVGWNLSRSFFKIVYF